jgi:hypothetical protein
MSKWTKTSRDPGRNYLDEKKLERRKRMLSRIFELVEIGIEAEPQVVVAAKEADPEITAEKLQEVITKFREAVYERQQRDRLRR